MLLGDAPSQSARYGNLDIQDPVASFAVKMVMGRDIPVEAGRTRPPGDLIDVAIGDEYLEIAVHGAQREGGHLDMQGRVDLRRGRMAIGSMEPFENAISLAGTMASRGRRRRGGGCAHAPTIEGAQQRGQAQIKNCSQFAIDPGSRRARTRGRDQPRARLRIPRARSASFRFTASTIPEKAIAK
jgi:hypothetical protein